MAENNLSESDIQRLESELAKITVDDLLLQTIVTLINLGARKAGLVAKDPQDAMKGPQPDFEQLHQAIEGARALMPLLQKDYNEELGPIRDSLARLQMIYAQNSVLKGPQDGGAASQPDTAGRPSKVPTASTGGETTSTGKSGKGVAAENQAGQLSADKDDQEPDSTAGSKSNSEPGPAQKSGRLWVPGQR